MVETTPFDASLKAYSFMDVSTRIVTSYIYIYIPKCANFVLLYS